MAGRLGSFSDFPFLSEGKLRHFDRDENGSTPALKIAFFLPYATSAKSREFAGYFSLAVASRPRLFHDFPFPSDRKERQFDRKQPRELTGSEGNFLPFTILSQIP
ncbi:hypothetical protein KFK09_026755 [Dendrobium nobile]|uniref:Uncharacterized protein n=1 Tax=Dendrobium nobile TaxID=94219 RepID=A0A8T3A9L2_DENNO|nr:hypothetical protein KFK09_026755 [Dendrobium nobile]